ncbi:MAG: hypothetical protein U0T77_12975 [Chitinophagales bacterium]
MVQLLQNEQIVLTSKDKSITLTNFRVLYQSKEINKEIYLRDMLGLEVIEKNERYYIIIGVGCLLGALYFGFYENYRPEFTYILGFVSAFCYLSYFITVKRILMLSSISYNLGIPVKHLSNAGLKYLMDAISKEWERERRENKI